jgi:hypothetical protein
MLGIMSRSDRKGYLSINGQPMGSKELAKFVGEFKDKVEELLTELEYYRVFSRDEDGTIYNRRMVRESSLSKKRAEAGRLGGLSKQTLSKSSANVISKRKATLEDEDEDEDKSSLKNKRKGVARISFDPSTRCWSGIEASDMESWAKAYPACDINSELAKAGEWIIANPAKGKKSNYRRFIVNWLSRSQDRGGGMASARAEYKPSRIGETKKDDHDAAYWARVRELKAKGLSGEALTAALEKGKA